MAENTFEIILTARDEASQEIRKVKGELTGAEQSTKSLNSATTTATNDIRSKFKEAGKELKDFRKTLFVATAAMAALVSSVKEAAKYNEHARDSFAKFDTQLKAVWVTIGTSLAPALEGISVILEGINAILIKAASGWAGIAAFWQTFIGGIKNPIQAYTDGLNAAAEAQRKLDDELLNTNLKVATGETFEKKQKDIIELGRITVKSSDLMKKSWEAVVGALGELGTALSQAAEMGKGWAKAAAGMALAMAVVNTAQAVTLAFATYPWPFSMVVAGIVAAAGALQVATIAATKFHQGGIIRAHDGLAVGEVPIIAQTGEGILSRRGMANLGGAGMLNALNGGASLGGHNIHIEVNYPTIRSTEDIDALTEEISTRLAREADRL